MIRKINEVSIWLWVALSTLPCRQALAVDADTVENLTRRGLGMAMWVAIGLGWYRAFDHQDIFSLMIQGRFTGSFRAESSGSCH